MRYNGHKNIETLQCHTELLKDFILEEEDLKIGVSLVSKKIRDFAIDNLPMYDNCIGNDKTHNKIIIDWLNKVDFKGLAKLYINMHR
tara:strand:- start:1607 stop:1867 length:261 start_codon:yes stop_codon:yes gene_type:complete